MWKRTGINQYGKYFFKLLGTFMLLSVIPVLTVYFAQNAAYSTTITAYTQEEAQLTSDGISSGLRELFEQAALIADSLATDSNVKYYLSGDGGLRLEVNELLNLQISTRRNQFEIHVLSRNDISDLSTGSIPNLYKSENWGLLYELTHQESSRLLRSSRYKGLKGDYISLASARKVFNSTGELVGFVIVDIYRSSIYGKIDEYNTISGSKYMLKSADGTVVIDTENTYREGLRPLRPYPKTEAAVSVTLPVSDGFVGEYKVLTDILAGVRSQVLGMTALVAGAAVFFCFAASVLMTYYLTKPITRLKTAMQQVGQGNLDCRVETSYRDDLLVLEQEFNNLASRLQELIDQRVYRENMLKTARIEALQAQINPHFIYNTLGSVKALANTGEYEKISEVITNFSKLLRHAINYVDEASTMLEELDMVESYFSIQNIRFGERFTCETEVPKELLHEKVPTMLLQPLVENAVLHGLEGKMGPGVLKIRAWRSHDGMCISITDDGLGMTSEMVDEINRPCRDYETAPSRIGIYNVKQRLALYYGDNAYFSVSSTLGEGTKVLITIPELVDG